MTPLILAVDSGLDGAFVWMRGGKVLHHVLTRTMVHNRQLDLIDLPIHEHIARQESSPFSSRVAYLETPIRMRGKGEGGVETMFRNDGRVEERLRVLGYDVRRVLPKVWQDGLLDLSKYEAWTEKKCKPRIAEGWTLRKSTRGGHRVWLLSSSSGTWTYPMGGFGIGRETILRTIAANDETSDAVTESKSVLSHDTKAASVAYAREHFPGVELVPPRCKNPHDGLADALCIAAWATKQLDKETP